MRNEREKHGRAMALAAVVVAALGTPTPAVAADVKKADDLTTLVEFVNSDRAKAGCGAVTVNEKLTEAAQQHSQDLAHHQTLSHTGSDGSSFVDRYSRVGYSWSTAGENIASGHTTPESVMEGWMNSSDHRANILNCQFEEIGVGLAQPGSYWTQDFGTGG